jgi:hypothetical protein
MLTSMKLGLATTVAALSIAAVTSSGAAVNPTSAGETVGPAVARSQSRSPDAQPTQCWITPTTMTTALSAIGVPARAQGRVHQRAPLLRCRLKRVTNVRKILVTAAPVSSGAAANSQPNRLKGPAERSARLTDTEQRKNTTQSRKGCL